MRTRLIAGIVAGATLASLGAFVAPSSASDPVGPQCTTNLPRVEWYDDSPSVEWDGGKPVECSPCTTNLPRVEWYDDSPSVEWDGKPVQC